MKISLLALSFACCLSALPVRASDSDSYVPGADAVRIHILQAGPADAPHSILFLPGHTVSAAIWSQQLGYFAARGYRVVAIDARSQGESGQAEGNAPEDRARDIQAVITNLKLTHLTLVGWSQGVQDVAAYVDQSGTGAVERLVLVDSSISMGPDAVKDVPGFLRAELQGIAVYSRHPREYCDGMLHAIISTPAPADTFRQLDDECVKTPPDVSISMLVQDLFTVDRRPAIKKFDKPTLVVASGQSQELDAQKRMAAAMPQGKFVAVEHAAHAVFFDQPQQFNRLLEEFIAAPPHE